ncbi:MAG: replicative DNA helicase [Bacteroidales bacterium]
MMSQINIPNSVETEKELLGIMMYHTVDFDMVFASLTKEMFYDERHAELFEIEKESFLKHNKVDSTLVSTIARRNDKTKAVGGEAYIIHLVAQANRFSNYQAYVNVIREKFMLRELMTFGQNLYARAHASSCDSETLLTDCSRELDQLMNRTVSNDRIYKAPEIMDLVIEDYALRKQKLQNNEATGLKTGLEKFDDTTGGFQSGDLILIAGRPSMGKTAFALFAAMNMARADKHILFFSLEMSALQLGNRLLLGECDIPFKAFREGSLISQYENLMNKSAEDISRRSITIADNSALNMFHIRNIALRQKRNLGVDAIFIDYLQLINGVGTSENNSATRNYELGAITKACKRLAMELQVPVILLSQLNRGVEGRSDKHPMMSDLRESGAIEEDADMVCLLYREAYYTKVKDYKGELLLEKFRNGETGTICFTHNEGMRDFISYEPGKK